MDIEHILRDLHDLKEWKAQAEERIAALEGNPPLRVRGKVWNETPDTVRPTQ